MQTTNFKTWLETFMEEKGIDLEQTFRIESKNSIYGENIFSYGIVVESIELTNNEEQKKIKNMLQRIDFKNGDIKHYLRHLSQALVI